ncbi:sugar ABC transporter permease [Candidatus Borkfalkia ceftriaxoniphila]|uniref:Sugar ABC transporter permease n=1 Tax=Candidatus Borkfalkia ceftriaxoniphila TaxID=2508949 RepID=A0A4Q2KEF2_9FIRM|nr:sugar ABC transporter permease [Candidatus Borkfalkia ceftriaxoniphila]RXZ62280.1 sugar ABC transporter permease [Candidatus Borkfalkia ceftriaxoniphila]
MSGWKKQTILFGAAIFAFALFLAFTISGFVLSSKTSGFSLPEKNMKVISVQSEDDVSYISTDDLRLVCANGSEIQWEAALADRTSDVVVTSEYVVAGYVSERKVDVFDKENGEKLNTLEIPYPVLSLDADDANVYVAAKKGGLKGSEIYHFTDYAQEKEGVSLSLSNVIGDVKIHPQSKVLYGVSTDYNIFTFENASGALVSERFASVPYEPLALGFSGGELIVADTTGYINVFSGNSLERSVNTGMTLCAFAANDTSETVVAANVSGKAAIVNVNTGKVTKISAPTEVQSISVSDSGVIVLSEYRGFRTQFYDIDRIGTLLFFGWAKYVGLALTVLSIPVAVAGWFAVGDKRRVTLQKGLRRLKVGFRKSWKSYTFILPTFVLLGLFMYVPAVWGLILSFFDYVPGVYTRPVGFANFVAVLKDPFFTGGIGNMLIFLVTDLIKALVPAVLIAELILALNSKKAQYWVRVLIYIPGILPGVAVLLIWTKGIYGDMGLLNSIVELFGGRGTDWLGNDKTALMSLVMIGLPWVGQYILFYGALMSVPESYKESAKLDGCSWLKSILYIDFPMIRPQLKYVFIITFITSIQDFGRVYMTTGQTSATNIPALQMYMTLNSGSGYGRAAAMGMLLFIIVFGATLVNLKAQKTESSF